MADTKLSDLTAISELATDDELYIVDSSEAAEADQSKSLAVSLLDARYLIGTGAAVPNATGAGDVVAQLNALLAELRTLGLIAT